MGLALCHLHRNRVVYRDVKPENTLVGADGHVLLADFGVSKRLATVDGAPPEDAVSRAAATSPSVQGRPGRAGAPDPCIKPPRAVPGN